MISVIMLYIHYIMGNPHTLAPKMFLLFVFISFYIQTSDPSSVKVE